MGERMSQAEAALNDIRQRLREREAANGAYYCNYPSLLLRMDINQVVK